MKRHRRIFTGLLAAVAITLLQTASIAQIASDNASDSAYADGWTNGDNGGNGFLPWQALSGFPMEIDIDDPEPDNDLGAPAFRLGGGGGGGYYALRPFENSIEPGQSFKIDFDSFNYPTTPSFFEHNNLLKLRAGTAERVALYAYYYMDEATTFGSINWGIGAETANDNLNGGAPLETGLAGWMTSYTVPDSSDGFSLTLDILSIDTYRLRVVDDDVTKLDISGEMVAATAGLGIDSLELWSTGGDITDGAVPTTYFNNLQIVETPSDALPGDFNEDGKVDAADYGVWRKSIGTQDGYNLWRANFDRTAGSGAAAALVQSLGAVPEPATVAMVAAGMLAMVVRRPRRIGIALSK